MKYGNGSRVDFLLEDPARPPCYLEIKNVHMMRCPGVAEFPDAVTKRGAKHLHELSAMVRAGARAVMLYLAQIGSAGSLFSPATSTRPMGAPSIARAAGVEALARRCRVTRAGSRSPRPSPSKKTR